jgi:hypothetical protein
VGNETERDYAKEEEEDIDGGELHLLSVCV